MPAAGQNSSNILDQLEKTIRERREIADPSTSYVAQLFNKGDKKIAEKVGEEAVEVIIAALTEEKADLENEAADLLFHLMVLLSAKNSSLDAVCQILQGRLGLSGIEEKNSRTN